MIDVVTVGAGGGSIAWLSPEGTLKVGPQSAGADPGPALLRARAAPRSPSPTPTSSSAGSRPHLLGGEIPLDVEAARAGIERARRASSASPPRPCATGVLEISAWNQANALRQVTVKRGLDVRDFTLTTFGGSGSLLLCRLVDILGLPRVLVPPNPGNVSAFGLLTVDVKNDYVQTHVSLARRARPRGVVDGVRRPHRRRRPRRSPRRASPTSEHRFARTADLRYFGQAFEVRVAGAGGHRRRGARSTRWPRRFHAEHRALYGYDFAGDADQQVEWVNLRVSGIGPIKRPEIRRSTGRRRRRRATPQPTSRARGLLRRRRRVRRHPGPLAPRPGPGDDRRRARRSSRSSARPCRCTPASPPGSTTASTSIVTEERPA